MAEGRGSSEQATMLRNSLDNLQVCGAVRSPRADGIDCIIAERDHSLQFVQDQVSNLNTEAVQQQIQEVSEFSGYCFCMWLLMTGDACVCSYNSRYSS